jgi:hypothetical protein
MRAPRRWSTFRRDRASWQFLKRQWFTLLIAVGMVEAAVESDRAPERDRRADDRALGRRSARF